MKTGHKISQKVHAGLVHVENAEQICVYVHVQRCRAGLKKTRQWGTLQKDTGSVHIPIQKSHSQLTCIPKASGSLMTGGQSEALPVLTLTI